MSYYLESGATRIGRASAMAADFITDPTGDALDAALCAVQAAWACSQPDYGIPDGCDPVEGWIVDPDMM